jgi:hypothetical protein
VADRNRAEAVVAAAGYQVIIFMNEPENLLSALDTLIQGVEATLSAVVGDSSLCQISKDGEPANAVKYNEGKYYAVRTVRRLVAEETNPIPRISAVFDKARVSLDRYQHGRIQHPDWISYYRGEVDGYRAAEQIVAGVKR